MERIQALIDGLKEAAADTEGMRSNLYVNAAECLEEYVALLQRLDEAG